MGKQKIVISERDNIAVLFEDDVAVEFIIHRGDVLLGDIYLAQVENILPSIDAAFVNVGTDRMGFLHSSDVQGRGDLKNRLQPKQNLVVQVMKEPTGHKGPRVTTNIAMPGRFLVMMPESRGISISRRIAEQKERARLKSIVSLIKPPGVGVIIRTEAEEQADAEIQEDFETLIERWQSIVAMADTAKPPTLLYRDQDLLYRVIREMTTEDVKEIIVDTAFGQQRAQQLLQNWGVEHPIKVTLYNGSQSIMIGAGIDKEIKQALQTKVPLPSGGYLYVQPTEALTVVDVNSGKFTSLESQAETIRLTNLEAAKEIARQLRLRNIGGMIIVDFIDMESRAHQLSVLESFENELANDKAKPQIGQLSDLGLVEMTRHRQGQSLSEIFTKKCMGCSGSGLTLDDLNWAPANGGPVGRSKFPIRQGRGGPNNNPQQQQQRQPLPKPGGQTLKRFLNPNEAPLREGFLQRAKAEAQQQDKAILDAMSFQAFYQHRVLKKLGIRFANLIKVSTLPLGINGVVVRINPKAADIFTLVQAIEGAAYLPEMEYDYGDGQGNYDNGYEPGFDGPMATEDGQITLEEAVSIERTPDYEDPLGLDADEAAAIAPRARGVALKERVTALVDLDEFDTEDDEAEAVLEEPVSAEAEPVAEDESTTIRRRRGRTLVSKASASKETTNDGDDTPPKPRRGRPPKKAT